MGRAANRTGEVVASKYRLVRHLGSGGFGAVYEAQHTFLRRRFAIKFLHAELRGEETIMARFEREARAMGALENENIAAVTDFGVLDDGTPYIVMEFLEGEDLSGILAQKKILEIARAIEIVVQACRGVESVHSHGIIHRDLKPGNLFICRRGDGTDLVKVLDFGIAKLRLGDGDGHEATWSEVTLRTSYYMPPEQARGEKTLDHRADIYALGVILYETLSGKRPHPGDSYNAVLFHILTKPAIPLEAAWPGLPSGLVQAVHRAIHQEPQRRFATVADFAIAIAPYAKSGEPMMTRTTGRAYLIETAATTIHPSMGRPPPRARGSASSRLPSSVRVRTSVWVAASAVGVLALGLTIVLFMQRSASSDREQSRAPSQTEVNRPENAPSGSAPSDQTATMLPLNAQVAMREAAPDIGRHEATSPSARVTSTIRPRTPSASSTPLVAPSEARTPPPAHAPPRPAASSRLGFDRSNPYAQ
jgi:serine/threonine-protein kinase